jgi:hypothetical protein
MEHTMLERKTSAVGPFESGVARRCAVAPSQHRRQGTLRQRWQERVTRERGGDFPGRPRPATSTDRLNRIRNIRPRNALFPILAPVCGSAGLHAAAVLIDTQCLFPSD